MEGGNTDVAALRKALAEAKACTDKPTLIEVKTVIGCGLPNEVDSHDAHGVTLGSDEITATCKQLGRKYGEFEMPQGVYGVIRSHAAEKSAKAGLECELLQDLLAPAALISVATYSKKESLGILSTSSDARRRSTGQKDEILEHLLDVAPDNNLRGFL